MALQYVLQSAARAQAAPLFRFSARCALTCVSRSITYSSKEKFDVVSHVKDMQLAAAWQQSSTHLTTAGNIGLSQLAPLHVFHVNNSTLESWKSSVAGLVSFPLTTPSCVQQFVDAAVPSPSGKGKDSVYDAAVGIAVEIKAAQVGLNRTLPPREVLEQVRALLRPNAAKVVADLDKLSIYGPGGFSKQHFGTRQSQEHFGTLVICLPSPFQGGELVLHHIDQHTSSRKGGRQRRSSRSSSSSRLGQAASATKTYDWSSPDDSAEPQALSWAAFNADTEHEVLPVTSGYRVTLTYNLRAVHTQTYPAPFPEPREADKSDANAKEAQPELSDAASNASNGSNGGWVTPGDVSASAELAAELNRLLADKDWHAGGARLGFVLQQQYAADLGDLAALSFPEALKGPDRVLAAALAQAGLQPRVVPIFKGWNGVGECWKDSRHYWEDRGPINFCRPLQPVQLEHPLGGYGEPGAWWALLTAKFGNCTEALNAGLTPYLKKTWGLFWEDRSAETLEKVFGAEVEDICWVTPVLESHFTYSGKVFGGDVNIEREPYEICYNATAAILVDVPSWADRRAVLAKNAA